MTKTTNVKEISSNAIRGNTKLIEHQKRFSFQYYYCCKTWSRISMYLYLNEQHALNTS